MISKITKLLLHLNSLDFGGGRGVWGVRLHFFTLKLRVKLLMSYICCSTVIRTQLLKATVECILHFYCSHVSIIITGAE